MNSTLRLEYLCVRPRHLVKLEKKLTLPIYEKLYFKKMYHINSDSSVRQTGFC